MTEVLEKLKQDMLDARTAYQDFMEGLKRPMTEEERIEHEKTDIGSFTNPLDGKKLQKEPYIMEFKDQEQFEKMHELTERMQETQKIFSVAYSKANSFEKGGTYPKLQAHYDRMGEEYFKIQKAITALNDIDTLFVNTGAILMELAKEAEEIQEQREMLMIDIVENQNKCDHNDGCAWEEDGYDSHKKYYKCKLCGKETSV